MKVDAIMTTNVVCCTGDTKIEDVARMMAQHDCGVIPVIDDKKSRKVVGILTDRDIVCRTLAAGMDPKQVLASECMTKGVYTCPEGASIDDCIEEMEKHHVRRIPIVDKDDCCCGLVSLTNIAGSLPESTTGTVVREITAPQRQAGTD